MTDDRARQIMDRSDILATHTMVEGQITRPYGTPALWSAREQVTAWMHEAGMTTRTDTFGNLIGRYDAAAGIAAPKTLLINGHIDSVVDAGRYDGTLGVLAGIAAVARLHEGGQRLPFAIEVLAIADEEGNHYHSAFLGSSALTGRWDAAWLDLTADDGTTLRDAIAATGADPTTIAADAFDPATLLGFIEVHIEQGPVLEAENLPVGAVSSITGSSRATVVVEGMAGHAGTVPMDLRRDALAAAAELVLAIEQAGSAEPRLVATVGRMEVSPGAPNVIPGRVEFTLDLRHADPGVRERVIRRLRSRTDAVAASRGVTIEWIDAPGFEGIACDARLTGMLESAIADAGHRSLRLYSGAGHDALVFAGVTPVSMLFVRCREGISHNPAESITEADVAVAIEVLDRFVAALAREGGEG
jgi:allantoate deiminase